MKLVLVTLALAAAPAAAFAPHVPESDEPTVSPTSYPTVKPTIKEVECVDAGCAEHPQCNKTNYDSGVVPFAGEDEVYLSGHYLQEGALAAGETSGNLGMYLGLGVKDDIVEPENEICE